MALRNLLIIFLLGSCTTPNLIVSSHVRTKPEYNIEPAPNKILLLHNCNIAAEKYRENKEKLFLLLLDSLLSKASVEIQNRSGLNTGRIKGYVVTGNEDSQRDSSIKTLLTQYNSTHAILVSSFDVFFDQTKVEVTRTSSGKDREAYYDIVSRINYIVFDTSGEIKNLTEKQSMYHSSRSVISGLLAAGPNITSNERSAFEITGRNLNKYLNHFFPGSEERMRTLFTTKDFSAVGNAIRNKDYETAMIESLRMANDPDKRKAAKAYYNCAVLSEKKDQPGEVRSWLQKSRELFELPEARQMMNDYN